MFLHTKYVILIISISLIISNTQTESNKVCAELIVDGIKSDEDQRKLNCLSKELEDNQRQVDLQLNEDAGNDAPLLSFLTQKSQISILNIPYDDNKMAINIIKAAEGFATDIKIQEDKADSDYTPASTTVANLLTDAHATTNLFTRDTDSADFGFIYTSNQNAVDILKAASSSTADSINKNDDDKNETQESELKYIDNSTPLLNTTSNSNESFNATTNVPTTTEKQLHDDGILLSEIVNLSLNDEETLTIGQKIAFESSDVESLPADIDTPGAEILRKTSLTCGSLFGKRISFANETTLMEFPWTALLLYNTKIRYHCGGSLITEKYVLTAAHCVAQEFYELIGVRLGEHDISEPVDCAPDLAGDTICANTVDADVVKIIVHHQYSHRSFKNDIALLRLDKDYISRSYYPICLPTVDMMSDDSRGTVAGWGATEKTIRSTVLLKAEVPIYDISKCREIYRYTIFNDSTEICGSGANEVDVCKGDSGGALFVNRYVRGKAKYYQLGIISLGVRRCGDSRFLPAVFTKITGFYKWIESSLEY